MAKVLPLKILHFQVPRLITAWIDEDNETFEEEFKLVLTTAECYMIVAVPFKKEYPAQGRQIHEIMQFFSHAIPCGGDMNPALADELLDDLSTDGREIRSEKIKEFGTKLLALTKEYGLNISLLMLYKLN